MVVSCSSEAWRQPCPSLSSTHLHICSSQSTGIPHHQDTAQSTTQEVAVLVLSQEITLTREGTGRSPRSVNGPVSAASAQAQWIMVVNGGHKQKQRRESMDGGRDMVGAGIEEECRRNGCVGRRRESCASQEEQGSVVTKLELHESWPLSCAWIRLQRGGGGAMVCRIKMTLLNVARGCWRLHWRLHLEDTGGDWGLHWR